MAIFAIHLINSEFHSHDDPREYASLEAAVEHAVAAAADVVRQLVVDSGEKSTAVEARIMVGDRTLARRIVTMNMLKLEADHEDPAAA